MFSVPTGLAVRRVQVWLMRGLVVTGPGISEELDPMEIDRLLVGRVIWQRGEGFDHAARAIPSVGSIRSQPGRCASALRRAGTH